jgi:hypothetical protein
MVFFVFNFAELTPSALVTSVKTAIDAVIGQEIE